MGIVPSAEGQIIVVIVDIHSGRKQKLPEVVDALNPSCLAFCFGNAGQEHSGQDGDHRNDHQQLD